MEELAGQASLRDAGITAGIATDKLLALSGDPALTQNQQHLHLHLQSTDIARQFNELLDGLTAQRRLTSKPGQPESSLADSPKPNNSNVSGNGNLSGDGPPAALTDETTEQRDSPGA